jgi:predicted O-methyltransferase YrrM
MTADQGRRPTSARLQIVRRGIPIRHFKVCSFITQLSLIETGEEQPQPGEGQADKMASSFQKEGKIMADDNDPFDCFGDDNSNDDDQDIPNDSTQTRNSASRCIQQRDPSNGILAFHTGTEQALLYYVQQKLVSHCSDKGNDRASAVLGHIDDFCLQRHWMMHVGNEKGPILETFLKECTEASAAASPLLFVELGTYCGYSSILMARALQKLSCGDKFHIYTVEVVEQNANVAREMIKLSGLEGRIHVLLLDLKRDTLTDLLRHNLPSKAMNFLFLDHSKSMYLSDLQELEKTGFIRKGCFVAADNVIFAEIDDYRAYTAELQQRGFIRTQLEMAWLEYCEPDHHGDETKKNMMKDGIGKLYPMLGLLKCQSYNELTLEHSFCRAFGVSQGSSSGLTGKI